MKILFDEMTENVQEYFRGGEGQYVSRVHNDGTCKVVLGKLAPGSSIGMHTHETSSETIFILSGIGTMYLGEGGTETLNPGDVHYCPLGGTHSLVNEGDVDLIFHCVVPEHKK